MKPVLLSLLSCVSALSVFCVQSGSSSETHFNNSHAEAVPDTFVVAFYNVENLFDLNLDGTEYQEYKVGFSNWDSTMQEQKLANIADVISAAGAHIVTLCEIENKNALSDLIVKLKDNNINYPHSAIADTPFTTVTCPAVISKFPVKEVRTFPVKLSDKAVSRNILEADITIDTTVLKLFVNHWPSKHHPESWRLETAKILLSRIQQLPSGTDYIIIGDLNSDYDENIKFRTMGMDNTDGITGINHILKTLNPQKTAKPLPFTEKDFHCFSGVFHYNLWLELPYYERMSHFYKGNRQTPDNILLPCSMYDSTGISYCDNSFEVFTWNGKLLKHNRPFRWEFRWQKNGKRHVGNGYSDHLPILARFKTGKFTPDTCGGQPHYPVSSLQNSSGIIDFELTDEGLVACNNSVEIRRDTVNPSEGKYCLAIRQEPVSSNITIARKVFQLKKTGVSNISFDFLGKGKISFRTRETGKKWVYYNGPEFTKSKSARYKEVSIPEWKRINLKCENIQSKEMEFEIRSGKGYPVHIYLDNIKY